MTFQINLALQYLTGRKLRAFLTTLAIVIGVMVIFGMGILLPTFTDALQKALISASGQVDVTITHKSGEAFSTSTLNKVRNTPGISAIGGSLSRQVNLPTNFYGRDSTVNSVTLTGVDPTAAPTLRTYNVTQGRFLRSSDSTAAVIPASLADSLGVKVGDTFRFPATEGVVRLTVIGLLPGHGLGGSEEVLVTLNEAQKLFDATGLISSIEANLYTQDKTAREAIVVQIQNEVGRYYAINALTDSSSILASLGTAQAVIELLGFLTLFMGGFIIFNTFRTIVAERRHDIGMLRAIGANRLTIVGLIMVEGLLQGVVGTAIGLAVGYGLALIATMGLESLYQDLLHIKLGAPVIDPAVTITAIALGVGVTLIAGLLPAISAGRVTPIEVLRPAASNTSQRVGRIGAIVGAVMVLAAIVGLLSGNFGLVALGGILILMGLVLLAPALVSPIAKIFGRMIAIVFARDGTGELAEGNVTRQPTRAAITASATMIGLAIVVASGGMIYSLSDSITGMFVKSMGSDYLMVPPSIALWKGDLGASQTLSNKIRSTPGVAAISTLRYAQSTIPLSGAKGTGETPITILGIDPVTYPQVAGMDFRSGNPQEAYAALGAGRNIIINGLLAAQTGLKVGDTVTLAAPQGQQDYQVAAIGGDVLDLKLLTAYISQANLRTDFNKTEDILFQISLAPGADTAAVDKQLNAIAADYPQFRLIATKQYLDEFKTQFDAIFSAMYILLGVLSLPSLIAILNTLAIGVIERTREIGMLRAIGAARKQISRMIVTEALLLSVIGTALGLLAGLYLGYVMVNGIKVSGIYRLEYSFPYAGVIAATAAGLIFGVLAALVPARQATQMRIIQALRYE
jgi:putative ABC transport system permease protein